MSSVKLDKLNSRTFNAVKPGLFGIDCSMLELLDDNRWVFDGGWLFIT